MTSQHRIDVGELVRITNGEGFKTKPAGELFDPADVLLTLRPPSGEVVDLSGDVANDSVGLYHADYIVTESGRHWFRWDGDAVIEENFFDVEYRHVGVPA